MLFSCFWEKKVFNSNYVSSGWNKSPLFPKSWRPLSVICRMWEHFAVLWHLWSSDTQDNETDRHKHAEAWHILWMKTEDSAEISTLVLTHGAPTIAETALQLRGQQSPNPSPSHPLRGSDLLYIHAPQVASLNKKLSRLLMKDAVNTQLISVSRNSGKTPGVK